MLGIEDAIRCSSPTIAQDLWSMAILQKWREEPGAAYQYCGLKLLRRPVPSDAPTLAQEQHEVGHGAKPKLNTRIRREAVVVRMAVRAQDEIVVSGGDLQAVWGGRKGRRAPVEACVNILI